MWWGSSEAAEVEGADADAVAGDIVFVEAFEAAGEGVGAVEVAIGIGEELGEEGGGILAAGEEDLGGFDGGFGAFDAEVFVFAVVDLFDAVGDGREAVFDGPAVEIGEDAGLAVGGFDGGAEAGPSRRSRVWWASWKYWKKARLWVWRIQTWVT